MTSTHAKKRRGQPRKCAAKTNRSTKAVHSATTRDSDKGSTLRFFPSDYNLKDDVWFPRAEFASSEFSYSDGDEMETAIHRIVTSAKDKSLFSSELLDKIHDWPSRYHLSATRANLLRPFQHLFRSRVLEVGAGCGALTRFLGECGGTIFAIEGSARRAGIARARASNLKNVSVICDRIEEFHAGEKFDVVVVVGVLEYARVFGFGGDQPEQRFLNHISRMLSDEGVLILAIENQLGLKYFAGACEDHLGVPYAGINDEYTPRSPVTFGLGGLQNLLAESGLTNQRYFLPLPDYKLPTTVMSGAGLDDPRFDAEPFFVQSVNADFQLPQSFPFSLERAWSLAVRNRLALQFGNSFLVVAGRNARSVTAAAAANCVAWHYSVDRHPAFARETRFLSRSSGITIKRKGLCHVARADIPNVPLDNILAEAPYRKGVNYWLELVSVLNRPGWSVREMVDWSRKWIDLVVQESGLQAFDSSCFSDLVSGHLLDAIPFNCILDTKRRLQLIDQEWCARFPIELGYIVFRGLRDSIMRVTSFSEPEPGTPTFVNPLITAIFKELGVMVESWDIDRFARLELRVQRWISGRSDEHVDRQAVGEFWRQPLNIRDCSALSHAEAATSFGVFSRALNSELDRAPAEHLLTLASLQDVKNQQDAVQQRNAELEDVVTNVGSELERTRAEHALTLASLQEVEAQRTAMQRMQQKNIELEDVAVGLDSELKHTHAEHALTLASLEDLKVQRDTAQQRNVELEDVVTNLGSELERTRAEHALTLASLEEINAQRNAVEKQNAELENVVAGLASELEDKRAEHAVTLTSLQETEARWHAVQQLLEQREMEYRGVINSTSWRVMAPLRKLGERAPWLARNSRRLRKLL